MLRLQVTGDVQRPLVGAGTLSGVINRFVLGTWAHVVHLRYFTEAELLCIFLCPSLRVCNPTTESLRKFKFGGDITREPVPGVT